MHTNRHEDTGQLQIDQPSREAMAGKPQIYADGREHGEGERPALERCLASSVVPRLRDYEGQVARPTEALSASNGQRFANSK